MRMLAALVALMLGTASAFAQNYPTKPVRVVVGFAAGGPSDVIGRIVAQKLSESLSQQFYVENVGGAGGNTAAGQNKVLVGPVVTPVIFPASAIKNGNLTVSVSTTLTAPATVTGAEAGCPNPTWTGVNPVLTVTSIQFVIEQPVGTPIFSCSATDPFSGTIQLTC